MEVISIKEQEDGSAIVELDVTQEEKHMLIEVGFNSVIKEYLKKYSNSGSVVDGPTNEL